MSISVDRMASEVISQVDGWFESFNDQLQEDAVDYVAKTTVKKLKETSPRGKKKRNKRYASTWTYTKGENVRRAWRFSTTVYNKSNYQLTHLLEFGHAKLNGGRTRSFPHIAPAEEEAAEMLYNKVKEILR